MRSTPLVRCLLLALALAAPAAAEEVHLSFAVSGNLVSALLQGIHADLDCSPDLSPAAREAFAEVAREGPTGRARFVDGQGDRVLFARHGSTFRVETTDGEGREVTLRLPWGLAECLFGGISPEPAGLARWRGQELRFDLAADDERVELSLARAPR